MSGEYIDVTPTWEGLVSEMLRILPHATAEGARDIHKQILKAARVADLHVAKVAAEQEQERERARVREKLNSINAELMPEPGVDND